jgi:hypothetical protein
VRALHSARYERFRNTLKLRHSWFGTKLAIEGCHMMSTCQSKLAPALLALVGALALPACAGLEQEPGEDEFALSGEGVELSLEWVIFDGETLLSCVDVGATELEIAVLGETEERRRISCFGGYAVIDGLAPGQAIIEVSLVAPNGALLMTSDVGEVSLRDGVTSPLGAVEFGL